MTGLPSIIRYLRRKLLQIAFSSRKRLFPILRGLPEKPNTLIFTASSRYPALQLARSPGQRMFRLTNTPLELPGLSDCRDAHHPLHPDGSPFFGPKCS